MVEVDVYLFLMQVDGHVSRDPSRLTRLTKGWEERKKNIGPSGGGPVLQMFHRSDCLYFYCTLQASIKVFYQAVTEVITSDCLLT